MNIVGHDQVLEFFDKVIKNDKLSHAYCFAGPANVGKFTIAKNIAAQILGVEIEKLGVQPDYSLVEQEENEKTGKTKRNIDIDQIRSLRETLTRRAFLNGYKVAIINEAEKMNTNSANALLKTLEEPKEKTVIFLVTENEDLLPSTIRSRSQIINFDLVKTEKIEKVLKEKKVDKAEEISRLCMGRPGLAITWAADTEAYEAHKAEIVRFATLFGKNFHDKIKIVEDLFGDKTDHILARQRLQSVLSLWLVLFRDALSENSERAFHKVSQKLNLSNKQILKNIYQIQKTKDLLNKNVHPRLLLEEVLLNI